MSRVFLTGGTGFIGTYVAQSLVRSTDHSLIVLVKAKDVGDAVRRLRRVWSDRPDLLAALGTRVRPVIGNVARERLGLDDRTYREVVKGTDVIIHAAADLRLSVPLDELRQTNVQGVRNMLALAEEVRDDHGLDRLAHVSTAYVAGGRQGIVSEEDLTDEHGFLSNYERSKFEGESLVRKAMGQLPISVFRPGMVIGDTITGYVRTFNTLYYPLRLYLAGRLRFLPIDPERKVNLVPVDYVAEAIAKLTFDRRAEGRTFHLVGQSEALPTVREMVELTRAWARERLQVSLPAPFFVPAARRVLDLRSGPRESLAAIAPYLEEDRVFRRDNVDELLGPYPVTWRELLPRLLEFGTYTGFLHRTERTVHEQVLFRLKSRSRPVKLYDIVDGKAVNHPAEQVRGDMLKAIGALRNLGIEAGDRVAIVGNNSTRYLILDVAIGMVGAVSVPLYYTSPPPELDRLLDDCRAKVLFIGSAGVLRRIGEMRTTLPIVSFCSTAGNGRAQSWEEFLARGSPAEEDPRSPVGFEDLATLRYTSSTTGQAKGVQFKHAHLRYMAESTASLPPWEVRNSEVFYLSFLPMNHVVEGILATYSPFYAPTPVNLYFLEDFRALREALPLVRPTVFFSVPRFYEKLWYELMNNKVSRDFFQRPNRAKRAILGPLIRRRVLKGAGLDRCRYLISGSGPMGPEVLGSFRSIGIEVHDAYGETEAPLVTINYWGHNRIGTVGEPLPETVVRIAEDGEVLVKGPQVTCGYSGDVEQPFRDGWLLTGDYGRLTPEGSLVLEGRKKDLIKTAYGKFVHPLKIETMLRDLPEVFEAMLVGEGRPYCTALIWCEKGALGPFDIMDQRIEEINSRLSHPEQVKGWAVVPNDLTIEGGELTANLKLKRKPIMERYAAVIEAMYGRTEVPGFVLHLGRTRGEG